MIIIEGEIMTTSMVKVEYSNSKKRIIKLDIARTFAILCVILCHSSEALYQINKSGWNALSNQSRIFMILSHTIGRLGVPIFLFLSGALLLKKSIDSDEDVFKFYKYNLLPLFIVNEIWVVIYNIFFYFTNQRNNVTLEFLIKELLCLKQVPVPNMWYFPMILGMYLGIPFVAKIVKTFSFKSLSILLSGTFIVSFALPAINILLKIFGVANKWNSLLDISFFGGAYGLYIVLGYFIANNKLINLTNLHIWIITIISFGLTLFMQLISYSDVSRYTFNVWYDNPFLLICTAGIFILFNRIDDLKINKTFSKFFTFMSKISLSLFFLHYIIQYLLKPYIIKINVKIPIKMLILYLSIIVICTLISLLLSKIKFIAKHAMLIKN